MIQIGFVLFVLFIVMEIALVVMTFTTQKEKAQWPKTVCLSELRKSSGYRELASHGYVVVRLNHPYHSFFTPDTDGILITVNPDFLQEAMRVSNDEVSEKETVELTHK